MIGELNCFLGLHIKKTSSRTLIHQQKYMKELLKRLIIQGEKQIDTLIATAIK